MKSTAKIKILIFSIQFFAIMTSSSQENFLIVLRKGAINHKNNKTVEIKVATQKDTISLKKIDNNTFLIPYKYINNKYNCENYSPPDSMFWRDTTKVISVIVANNKYLFAFNLYRFNFLYTGIYNFSIDFLRKGMVIYNYRIGSNNISGCITSNGYIRKKFIGKKMINDIGY